jgi:integrase
LHHSVHQLLAAERLLTCVEAGLKPAQGPNPKYTGFHCLRHFYASWCINRVVDGGLELPPKIVQERLGHSTLAMTMDRYGHLFPVTHDAEQLDNAVLRIISEAP